MVDIPEPAPPGVVIPDEQRGREQGRATRRRPLSSPRKTVSDLAFVMGIPPAEFTPRVEEAIAIIMGEFDRQRIELERAKVRIAFLEEQGDAHSFLPVSNRRAFLRAMSVAITRAGQTQTQSTLVLLSLRNATLVREQFGRAALDAALLAMAGVLKEAVRASDSVGSLGGGDFGLILALAEGEAAREKTLSIVRSLAEAPIDWGAERVALDVAWGSATFSGRETIRAVLDSAEQDLLARNKRRSG